MKSSPLCLGVTGVALLFATGCSSTVASLDGPGYRQKLSTPQPVAVSLGDRADAQTFRATLNGNDITEHFVFQDQDTAQLNDFVFEPTTDRKPHQLTVSAEPAVNAKGRLMGQPFSETLTFYPPALTLQGNVGIGHTSHVKLNRDGRTSVMLRLPVAAHQSTTVTILPVRSSDGDSASPFNGISINDNAPGQAIQLTLPAGRRVAVFTVRGQNPGGGNLRVEAPGYVAADIDVHVEGQSITAAAYTRY